MALTVQKSAFSFWHKYLPMFLVTLCVFPECQVSGCKIPGDRVTQDRSLRFECDYCVRALNYKVHLHLEHLSEEMVSNVTRLVKFPGLAEVLVQVYREPGARECSPNASATFETMDHLGLEVDLNNSYSYILHKGVNQSYRIHKTWEFHFPHGNRQYKTPYLIHFDRQFPNNTELLIGLPFNATLSHQQNPKHQIRFQGEKMDVLDGANNRVLSGSMSPALAVRNQSTTFELVITRPEPSNFLLLTNLGTPTPVKFPEAKHLVTDMYPQGTLKNLKVHSIRNFEKSTLPPIFPYASREANVWTPVNLDSSTLELVITKLERLLQYFYGMFGESGMEGRRWDFVVHTGPPIRIKNSTHPSAVYIPVAAFQPTRFSDSFYLAQGYCYQPLGEQVASLWMPQNGRDGEVLSAYVGKWATPIYDPDWQPNHCCQCVPEKKLQVLEMLEGIFGRDIMQWALTDIGRLSVLNLMHELQKAIQAHAQTHLLPENGSVSIVDVYLSWSGNRFVTPRFHVAPTGASNSFKLIQDTSSNFTWAHHENNSYSLWWIPVKYLTEQGQGFLWLSPPSKVNQSAPYSHVHRDSRVNTEKWLVFNPDNSGLYTVNYADALLSNNAAQLSRNHRVIPEDARSQLLSNQASVLDGTWETQRGFLELSKYLTEETSWKCLDAALVGLEKVFSWKPEWNAEVLEAYQNYFGPRLDRIWDQVGPTQPVNSTNCIADGVRRTLWGRCVEWKIPRCMGHSRRTLEKMISDPKRSQERIFSGNRTTMACAAIQQGPAKGERDRVFQFFMRGYSNNLCDLYEVPVCRNIVKALACTQDAKLREELLLVPWKFGLWEPRISSGFLRHNPESAEVLLPLYRWWRSLVLMRAHRGISHTRFFQLVKLLPDGIFRKNISHDFPDGILPDIQDILLEDKRRYREGHWPVEPEVRNIHIQLKIPYAEEALDWFQKNE